MRRVVVGSALVLVLVALVLVLAPRVTAQPAKPVKFSAGTWTVVCKEQLTHSCGREPGEKSTHLWTVTAEKAGRDDWRLDVKVVGDPIFPTLKGKTSEDKRAVMFEARSDKPFFSTNYNFDANTHFFSSSFFYFTETGKAGEAIGLRRWSGYKMTPSPYANSGAFVACTIHSTCTAKKAD
jgi:hypothetical protein